MDVSLKHIPEPVYRTMKREAKQQGRSLNAQIIRTMETEAEEVERRRRLPSVRKALNRFASALAEGGEIPAPASFAGLVEVDSAA